MVLRSSNYRLNDTERDFVFSLIERVTGTCQEGSYRREVLASNVERRIRYVGAPSLRSYLSFALRDKTEEEAYSIALTLEKIRRAFPGFEYRVEGVDIDPLSIATASRGVYGEIAFPLIPGEYRPYCVVGRGTKQGLFAPSKDVRRRCSFSVRDLWTLSTEGGDVFDCIFCRNLLIYFKSEDVTSIVGKLLSVLHGDGALFLRHSEAIDAGAHRIQFLSKGGKTTLTRAFAR